MMGYARCALGLYQTVRGGGRCRSIPRDAIRKMCTGAVSNCEGRRQM